MTVTLYLLVRLHSMIMVIYYTGLTLVAMSIGNPLAVGRIDVVGFLGVIIMIIATILLWIAETRNR